MLLQLFIEGTLDLALKITRTICSHVPSSNPLNIGVVADFVALLLICGPIIIKLWVGTPLDSFVDSD